MEIDPNNQIRLIKARAAQAKKNADGIDIRNRGGRFDNVDALEYLEQRQMEYVKAIEDLAVNGEKGDLVRLKANQILLNKILPDKTRHEVGLDNTSPMTILLAAIQQNQIAAGKVPAIEAPQTIPLPEGKKEEEDA